MTRCTSMTKAEAQAQVDACVLRLAEHFASVQIVTSRLVPSGGTEAIMSGSGDWYARKSLCQEFVERDQADTIARSIHQTPPDPSEEWKGI